MRRRLSQFYSCSVFPCQRRNSHATVVDRHGRRARPAVGHIRIGFGIQRLSSSRLSSRLSLSPPLLSSSPLALLVASWPPPLSLALLVVASDDCAFPGARPQRSAAAFSLAKTVWPAAVKSPVAWKASCPQRKSPGGGGAGRVSWACAGLRPKFCPRSSPRAGANAAPAQP
jgi:hypothetical protein